MRAEPESLIPEEEPAVEQNSEFPKLDDVMGSEKLREELDEILMNIENEEIFKAMQISPYKTFLFTGPPGNGKTFATKAIRNSASERQPIAWFTYDLGRYGSSYINMNTTNLQHFLDNAQQATELGYKALLFFDEADVVMSQRGTDYTHKEDDKMLETLMKHLQEVNNKGENQYIIFATNFPEAIDTAAIRSQRIDKVVEFENPDENIRYDTFQKKTRDYNEKMMEENNTYIFEDMDIHRLVDKSWGFSMADITSSYVRAIRRKVYEAIKTGAELYPKVGEEDFIKELQNIGEEKRHKGNQSNKIGLL